MGRRIGVRVAVDLVPAAALVFLTVLVGWLLPLIGGPRVVGTVGVPFSLASTAVWVILALAVGGGLFVSERIRAVARKARDGSAPLSPLGPALRRFLVRRGHRIAAAAAGGVLVQAFMPTFIGFKMSIPEIQGFGAWDRRFVAADRVLHGGVHPWELLHPLLGNTTVTALLDALYYAWFPITTLGFLLLATWSVGRERGQFLLAFAGTWVFLGIVMAAAMASVGPCYLVHLPGFGDPYAELTAYLASVDAASPVKALEVQALLWESYEQGLGNLTSGIAAMPSLHVAIPALFAVASWRRSRALSGAFWVLTLLIFLGSVHLGWHYAIDGYVSVAMVFPLWAGAGRVASSWLRRWGG